MDNTSPIYINSKNNSAEERTSPIYVQEKGKLSLNDILHEKPSDFSDEIDISWLNNALNQKAAELKYAPWDAIAVPEGLWTTSAYGNNHIIACAIDGNIIISNDYSKTYSKQKIGDSINAIAYGDNAFIACGNNGSIFITHNNGSSWENITYENYNFTSICYNNNMFLLGTDCGKIFITYDKCKSFNKSFDYENMMISKIIYENNIIMALGLMGDTNCIYSIDNGKTYHKLSMPASKWCGLTYGKNHFFACAYEGDIKLMKCSAKSLLENNAVWYEIPLPKNAEWKDIAYGKDVFVLVSLNGDTMASYDGTKWLETKNPQGAWNNILRTDYFFMAFSINKAENNLNAILSSNGGLAGIMFASINEVINNEVVDKAINPSTLRDYLKYRTGKEENKYPVYSKDLVIECTSTDTMQIKVTNIMQESNITDFNNIKTSGIYIIEKKLENAPCEYNKLYMLVQKDNSYIYQFVSYDYNILSGYIRKYSDKWLLWEEKYITEKNIVISSSSTFSASNTFIMNENNKLTNITKDNLFQNITSLLLKNGKIYLWDNSSDYEKSAIIMGSDNAIYIAIKNNGISSEIHDPVTSNNYWLKIINNDGKINADNLSITLGNFAVLNNININHENITGILSQEKGGTGSSNGLFYKNSISIDEFFNHFNITPPITINELVTKLIESDYKDYVVLQGVTKDHISNMPCDYSRLLFNFFSSNQATIYAYANSSLLSFACFIANGVCSNWFKLREENGSIPYSMFSLPSGFIYVQFRNQLPPDEIFKTNDKWQDISSEFSGQFFRAAGGNALSFGNIQNEGLPNIVGESDGVETSKIHGNTGCFEVTAIGGGKINTANLGGINYRITFNAGRSNSIYGSNAHVTPYNSTIRIWKKL